MKHFKDHNNQDITDPWIERTNTWANYGVNDAKVVWADEAGLVQFGATKIVHDASNNAFVQFEVPAANIKNGNAVIAVMKNGTVVWSWHLWFIHDDVLNTTACWNYQNKEYDFTEESLGMKYTSWTGTTYTSPRSVKVKVEQKVENGGVKKIGILTITQKPNSTRQGITTFYQFGRKDAFPPVDAIAEGAFNKNAGNNMSIQNGIQHPENFYTNGSSWESNPPAGYSYYNLWSANNTTTGYNDNAVVKTVYDPCPVGFKIPASNAFTGFTTDGQNFGPINVTGTWNNGHNFNNKITNPDASVYFPASGSRNYNNGSVGYVGIGSYYCSAIPENGPYYCCYLNFSKVFVVPQASWPRSLGYCVRPVADPKTNVKLKTPGSTEDVWEGDKEIDAGEIEF